MALRAAANRSVGPGGGLLQTVADEVAATTDQEVSAHRAPVQSGNLEHAPRFAPRCISRGSASRQRASQGSIG